MKDSIKSKELLGRLSAVEKLVRADLLGQYRTDPALMSRAMQRLRDEESASGDAKAWLETFAGRGAVLYLLKTLYVRVLEDQGLLAPIRIRDGGSYELFRRLFPQLGHGTYLRTVFRDAERALPELFAPTPVEIATPCEASASAVWSVWQEAASGGGPRFDFRGELDTRFIGDLYQDLDPEVKARYALLQTPRFIESFILDRTMDPALAEFGLETFRLVDPTCGSGHFLLGAFERLARSWRTKLGETPEARWDAATRALAAVHGADLNEYACALSRFRLLLAIVRETGVTDLERLRTLPIDVITCDALIPWERSTHMLPGTAGADASFADYGTSEERTRNAAFFARGYHAVVGNPPYIAVKDKKKREDYRRAWPRSASGKYSLSAPMTERFLLLPVKNGRAGFIVANNFCKRSFGRGVVEKVLRDICLDLVVDSSGAYIPGHGTPTVMLFASRRSVVVARHAPLVVAGKRGEPREPADPASGIVWSAIATHWADAGYEDTWIATQRVTQATLTQHPWSLGSDAVTAIKAKLDAFPRLRDFGADAGFAVIIAEDEAFVRRYARALPLRPIVFGEDVRDWRITPKWTVLSARSLLEDFTELDNENHHAELWPLRRVLEERLMFGKHPSDFGKHWGAFMYVMKSRVGSGQKRIAIGEVATNSQFVYDDGDAVFTQTAPVLTLRDAGEARYCDVAAVLNSSTLEFWFKQVCFPKGGDKVGDGRTPGESWEERYVRNGTNVVQAPTLLNVANSALTALEHRIAMVTAIDSALAEAAASAPRAIFAAQADASLIAPALVRAAASTESSQEQLVGLQEELDWSVYAAFELIDDIPLLPHDVDTRLARGHRPFEIALARRIEAGEEESAWFERHGLDATTQIPGRYGGTERDVLERRLALIETDATLAILEQPVYKRRWAFESWSTMLRDDATAWLLDALGDIVRAEMRSYSSDDLLQRLRADPKAVVIAGYARDPKDIDLSDTITRLLHVESVSDNPARVLTPAGLAKLVGSETADTAAAGNAPRTQPFADGEDVNWKRVWRLQEREDAGETVAVAVPPPFKNSDYARPSYWSIRGKFNIPNERFVVYDELTPKRYAWGGWTTVERARLSMEAFELRGREPDAASVQPTREDPRRCGIQFPIWDKLDELRRTSDPDYDDVREIAQLCGRACPCDVLDQWRLQGKPLNNRSPVKSAAAAAAGATTNGTQYDTAITREQLAAVLATMQPYGDLGIALAQLEPSFNGDREAARRAVERLRSEGAVEPIGRGRGLRYRIPTAKLL